MSLCRCYFYKDTSENLSFVRTPLPLGDQSVCQPEGRWLARMRVHAPLVQAKAAERTNDGLGKHPSWHYGIENRTPRVARPRSAGVGDTACRDFIATPGSLGGS